MSDLNSFTAEQMAAWNDIEKEGKSMSELPEKYRKLDSTSARIRAMRADGYQRGMVAKLLGIKYQFVRNVEIRGLKKPA